MLPGSPMSARRIRRLLADGEVVVRQLRPYPLEVLQRSVSAAAGIALAVMLATVASPYETSSWEDQIAGWLAALLLARAAWAGLRWRARRITVTDRQVIETNGILVRSVRGLPLTSVAAVTLRRSVPGRLLGYGEVVLGSAGGRSSLGAVRDPRGLYVTVCSLVSRVPEATSLSLSDDAEERIETGPLPRVVV
ncbi:MAG: PH domain-containing protein [Actinomycetota bacterium]|nr:PH domain-containing protein [Actinomycetota bacterium]